MSKLHQAIDLLRDAHDALDVGDSELTHFEDDDEERESAPDQYAARKVMHAIHVLEAMTPNA